MSLDSPIAVFDSGLGGLSVVRELFVQLPGESLLYFGDQAHVPYGSRPVREIHAFVEAGTRYFLARHAKLVVLACNTASAVALHAMRAAFPGVPFVGLEPAVKPAVERTQTGKVGVIATPTTLRGELFLHLIERFAEPAHVTVLPKAGLGFVEAVESGALDTPETEALVRERLTPLLEQGVDQLVLGCTHYSFLLPVIQRVAGPGVAIIDTAPAVARRTRHVMEEHGLLCTADGPPQHVFVTSAHAGSMRARIEQMLGTVPGEVRSATWNYTLTE